MEKEWKELAMYGAIKVCADLENNVFTLKDEFEDYIHLSKVETISLRDFLNSLDLEPKKDCPDGQHEVKQGELKCANCGTPYLHGQK